MVARPIVTRARTMRKPARMRRRSCETRPASELPGDREERHEQHAAADAESAGGDADREGNGENPSELEPIRHGVLLKAIQERWRSPQPLPSARLSHRFQDVKLPPSRSADGSSTCRPISPRNGGRTFKTSIEREAHSPHAPLRASTATAAVTIAAVSRSISDLTCIVVALPADGVSRYSLSACVEPRRSATEAESG